MTTTPPEVVGAPAPGPEPEQVLPPPGHEPHVVSHGSGASQAGGSGETPPTSDAAAAAEVTPAEQTVAESQHEPLQEGSGGTHPPPMHVGVGNPPMPMGMPPMMGGRGGHMMPPMSGAPNFMMPQMSGAPGFMMPQAGMGGYMTYPPMSQAGMMQPQMMNAMAPPTHTHMILDANTGQPIQGGSLLGETGPTENPYRLTLSDNDYMNRREFNKEMHDAFKTTFHGYSKFDGEEENFEGFKNKIIRACTTIGAEGLLKRDDLYSFDVEEPQKARIFCMPNEPSPLVNILARLV